MAHPGACATASTTVALWRPLAAPYSGHHPTPTHEQTIRDQLRPHSASLPFVSVNAPHSARRSPHGRSRSRPRTDTPSGAARGTAASGAARAATAARVRIRSPTAADPRAKQLGAQLDGIAARDTVTDRERLQPGPNRALGGLPRQLAAMGWRDTRPRMCVNRP